VGNVFDFIIRLYIDILNFVTMDTSDVVMDICVAVKTLLGASNVNFLNNAAVGEDFQVAIDRAKTDSGHFLAKDLVHFVRGGMAFQFAELFQNNLPLFGHTQHSVRFHLSPLKPINKDYYFYCILQVYARKNSS